MRQILFLAAGILGGAMPAFTQQAPAPGGANPQQ